MNPFVVISPRGEERLATGHPWIYRADIVDVGAEGGDIVVVRGPRARPLGRAFYSATSQIALRLLTYGDTAADAALVRGRIERAIAFRQSLAIDATAYRLVHGEADLLPSLIVDRYGDTSSCRRSRRDGSAAAGGDGHAHRAPAPGWDSRAQRSARALLEGLEQRVDVLAGEVPDPVAVRETGIEYEVDLRRGQKTGLFLDQRENRVAAAQYARGRLLDCFSYNGASRWCSAGCATRRWRRCVGRRDRARATECGEKRGGDRRARRQRLR